MTPKMNNKLSEIFGTEPSTVLDEERSLADVRTSAIADSIDSLESQREYVKGNIVKLLEVGMTALSDLQTIANATEKSRDFEVLGGLIRTLADTNVQLLDLEVAHKPNQQKQPDGTPTQMVQNNTTVFVGSTKELGDWLKTLPTTDDPDSVIDVEPK